MQTTLVVPCFNEAARLDVTALAAGLDADPHLHLVFANDGSADATPQILEAFRAAHPERVEVVTLPQNRGKAAAVQVGMLHAFESGATLVGYWDADLATPLDAAAEMRAYFESSPEVLLVMGARVKLLGRSIERKASRHYLGRMFATVASRVLRMAVYDTQCGAKLFRTTPVTKALFAEPFETRWIFDVEMLARLRQALRADPSPLVVEHPLRQWHDVTGSKVKFGDFVTAAFSLMKLAWTYRSTK